MSSEEYLDSLLKSLEEKSEQDEPSPLIKKIFTDVDDYETDEVMSSFPDAAIEEEVLPDELQADAFQDMIFGGFEEDGPSGNEILMDLGEFSDIGAEAGTDETDGFMDEDWKASLDELLAATDESKTISEADLDKVSVDDMDVTQFIDNMTELDDSLVEINELLKKSDNNEAVEADEEMLAFLNSFNSEDTEGLFSDEAGTDKAGNVEENASEPKKKFSFFSGKKDKQKKAKKPKKEKKAKQQKEAEETAKEVNKDTELDAVWDSIDFGIDEPEENTDSVEYIPENIETNDEIQEVKETKPKKQGFMRRLFEMLTAEEEEEAGDLLDALNENEEILKELETEDKAKKNKKDKKKKGKKDKKDNKDGEEQEEAVKPEKKKKPKKEKKPKDPLEKEMARSNKVLSKRGFITLIAFCSSLIAIIVALAFFLTDYADKKNARQAFYIGDYQTAYILLYDKVLSDSDALILERVRVILELERNIEVYDFYKKTEKEALALNALLDGVQNYHEISEVNDFGSGRELADIYEDILQILEDDYGVTEEEAKALNACESEEYTIKVYDIVNGTGTGTTSANEPDDVQGLEDVLPEEEGIIE